MSSWPVLWVMLPVFIGGMGLSMAGGIKINRAILVGRELASELRRLAYPSSVSVTRMRGRAVDMADFSATWAYMAIFILMTSAAIIVLGALGLEMEAVWAITFGWADQFAGDCAASGLRHKFRGDGRCDTIVHHCADDCGAN